MELELVDISKTYNNNDVCAIKSLNYTLDKSAICGIVGDSGCGKTTLLRIIAGLETPDNGIIKVNNNIVYDGWINVAPEKRQIGMVFQGNALFPHMTVKKNITFGLEKDSLNSVNKLIELFSLEDKINRYPHELSSGQMQRVAIARTLAVQPKILLLDEPFSNLDLIAKSKLRTEIKKIAKILSITVFVVTHDIFDALDICDEIIFINNGELIETCSSSDVKNLSDIKLKSYLKNMTDQAKRFISIIE